jgi:hypothetical protein
VDGAGAEIETMLGDREYLLTGMGAVAIADFRAPGSRHQTHQVQDDLIGPACGGRVVHGHNLVQETQHDLPAGTRREHIADVQADPHRRVLPRHRGTAPVSEDRVRRPAGWVGNQLNQ